MNHDKLAALKAAQLETLRGFLALNEAVHRELVDALCKQRSLDRDQLAPLLGRVRLPDDVPRPSRQETFDDGRPPAP